MSCVGLTSLPPLPTYPTIHQRRPRWGENVDMDAGGFDVINSGFARLRNNFDSCHPVSDVTTQYEGYMFPKPLHHDLLSIHNSGNSTCRKVPRTKGCQVFPRNDPTRQIDGVHLLGAATRKALSQYTDHLYKATSCNTDYTDHSDSMVRMLARDAHFRAVCASHLPDTPTCCRILNHPDPCPYCWTGGLDHDLNDADNHTPTTVTKATPHKVTRALHQASKQPTDNADQHLGNTFESTGSANASGDDNTDIKTYEQSDLFGPWSDSFKMSEKDENLLLPHYYNSRLPSFVHFGPTQNEFVSSFLERHDSKRYQKTDDNKIDYFGPWSALSRQKTSPSGLIWEPDLDVGRETCEPFRDVASLLPLRMRNTSTFRDENNLRIPCISNAIGKISKAEFQKRYHMEHPEPVPDLRDNMKTSKRVTFYGYNSFVYR